MNPPLPETPKLFLANWTDAASFRCRRTTFRRSLTVFLSVLTIGLFVVMFSTRHRGYESDYESACVETMDSLLLILTHWDAAPPSSRWVTGYLTREQFFETLEMYAKAAQRDGYFTDAAGLRMVMACLLFDRREEAEKWQSALTDSTALEWSRTAFASANVEATYLRFAGIFAYESAFPSDCEPLENPQGAAAKLYRSAYRTNAVVLSLCGAGLLFSWPVLRLLLKRSPPPARRGTRLERTWKPGRIWATLVRAEWVFLYSGLGLWGLSGLAWFASEAGEGSIPAKAATGYWDAIGEFYQSGWSTLFSVVLLTGPVFLMVRWLTPGFHATLRLFGIRRSPLSRGAFWRVVITGLAMVNLIYLCGGYLLEYFEIVDPRNSWSHGSEALWESLLFGCIVAPFMEEFIFRGFLFTAWRNSWGAPMAAICSSALFSIGHGYSLGGSLIVGCFGLLMCALYHRTGTLLVPMAIHALTNGILV